MKLRDLIDTLPNGLDTEVLGTLPMTADGCIVGLGVFEMFTISSPGLTGNRFIDAKPVTFDLPRGWFTPGCVWASPSRFYSTRSAAEQAAKEAK